MKFLNMHNIFCELYCSLWQHKDRKSLCFYGIQSFNFATKLKKKMSQNYCHFKVPHGMLYLKISAEVRY